MTQPQAELATCDNPTDPEDAGDEVGIELRPAGGETTDCDHVTGSRIRRLLARERRPAATHRSGP